MISSGLESEQSVIGAMLLDPNVIPQVMELVDIEDFINTPCRNLFTVCKELFMQGKTVDILTVLNRAQELNGWSPTDREAYKKHIVSLAQIVPNASSAVVYAEIVKNHSMRRKALEVANELVTALAEQREIAECQPMAVEVCEALSFSNKATSVSASQGLMNFMATRSKPKEYIKTGFEKLDKAIYIDRGDLLIVGGRPSSGKTGFTLQTALYMAKTRKTGYFSLETNAGKIYDRLICTYTGTPLNEIKTASITPQGWIKIAEASDKFAGLQLEVVPAAGWTVAQIHAKAVQLRCEVIFVDYLSLVTGKGKSLYEQVTDVSKGLHIMAQATGITIIALAQLNRDGGRKEPDLTSLRDSGQIEQDADAIMFLHDPDPEAEAKTRKLIVAKNKDGETGAMMLSFDGARQRFTVIDGRY